MTPGISRGRPLLDETGKQEAACSDPRSRINNNSTSIAILPIAYRRCHKKSVPA
jgi:hypothetical protein